MDLKTLQEIKPSEYAEAADGYRAISDTADTARERVDKEITKALREANEGEAADAAQKKLRQLSENLHYAQLECGLISGALNGFSAEIATPRRQLLQALDDAKALSYTVHADGSVSFPADGKNELTGEDIPGGTAIGNDGMYHGPGLGPDTSRFIHPNPHQAKAQDIANRIARALRDAAGIDERYSAALEKLKAAPGLTVDVKTWTDVAADADTVGTAALDYIQDHIPLDKSPAERKEWWDGLSDEERDEYKRAFPEFIGNLDGIPSAVRDEVNRENLDILIGKLSGEAGEKAKTQLDALTSIRQQLQENAASRLTTPKVPPMYLLGIGDEGLGRAIVAYGNPDTSKNVSAYVPGLSTALDTHFATNDLRRAYDTAAGARSKDPSSASIVWLGYDAPQLSTPGDLPTLASDTDVMSADKAKEGAPAYNSFMAGLAATNDHEDPHLVAIGHSYGSRLVGAATQEPGGIPGADDIILLGSPGTGVDKAEDLGVGKDHVFVGAAENDPVSHLPSKKEAVAGTVGFFGGGPLTAYLFGDIADQGDDDLWFGKDPASGAFGARRFQVADGPRPLIDGQGLTPAHSNYFDPEDDPRSAANIAALVANRPELVKWDEHR
ncbi:alpha/beta hydrolase family protein [Streptomyces sp. Go40/10]|uniref:alpha/beta hydrolase n=1 Tax=Streptomyces sp. Go40/10 TaxID=2825844 RepID=UPI001E5BE5CC|nr:alpha/beta hydrolase [Streptomyces sp. Go40/10]UFR04371.1 alpha/beta hydrolase family protein [Streptomyces sp. Go40/10]